jgi:hypothetical protein
VEPDAIIHTTELELVTCPSCGQDRLTLYVIREGTLYAVDGKGTTRVRLSGVVWCKAAGCTFTDQVAV